MRYLAQCSFIALALAWVSPAAAGDLEFHGYMRAGIGMAATGGPGVCYGLGNADSKYRLGNECDYVIEPTFNYHIAKLEDGADWGVVAMPSIYKAWGATVADFDDLPVRFGQIYVYGSNVPQLMKGTIWAGRRFYGRLQTGINDYFLHNEDGDGAGLENMQVGPAQLSLALLLNPNTGDTTVKPFKVEAHATIPTVEKGKLMLFVMMNNNSKTADQRLGEDAPDPVVGANLYNIGLYHQLDGILNGGLLLGGRLNMNNVTQLYRLVAQQGMAFPEFRTNVDAIVMYRAGKTRPDPDADWSDPAQWFSIGARTDTQISGPFRFLLEYGHDRTWATDVTNNSLNKLTGALAVNAGNDSGSRPTVRLYYTQAWWNEGAGPGTNAVYGAWAMDHIIQGAYAQETSGGTFGIQGEAWW